MISIILDLRLADQSAEAARLEALGALAYLTTFLNREWAEVMARRSAAPVMPIEQNVGSAR